MRAKSNSVHRLSQVPAAAGSDMAQLVCSRPTCRIVLMCASHLALPCLPPTHIHSPTVLFNDFHIADDCGPSGRECCGALGISDAGRRSAVLCLTLCRYPRGARQVQCSMCHTINCAIAVNPHYTLTCTVLVADVMRSYCMHSLCTHNAQHHYCHS